jgi:hypothetical protein
VDLDFTLLHCSGGIYCRFCGRTCKYQDWWQSCIVAGAGSWLTTIVCNRGSWYCVFELFQSPPECSTFPRGFADFADITPPGFRGAIINLGFNAASCDPLDVVSLGSSQKYNLRLVGAITE